MPASRRALTCTLVSAGPMRRSATRRATVMTARAHGRGRWRASAWRSNSCTTTRSRLSTPTARRKGCADHPRSVRYPAGYCMTRRKKKGCDRHRHEGRLEEGRLRRAIGPPSTPATSRRSSITATTPSSGTSSPRSSIVDAPGAGSAPSSRSAPTSRSGASMLRISMPVLLVQPPHGPTVVWNRSRAGAMHATRSTNGRCSSQPVSTSFACKHAERIASFARQEAGRC